jgi:hypothetical protein
MTLFLAAFACRNRKRSNCKVLLCCGGPHDARLWPQENRKALDGEQKFSCATARAEALKAALGTAGHSTWVKGASPPSPPFSREKETPRQTQI